MDSQHDDDLVRVSIHLPRVDSWQLSLFQTRAPEVLAQVDVRLTDMDRLHQAGLLSFDPRTRETLDPPEEAELRFLAGLVRAGCDISMTRSLLADLEPPYQYNGNSMVYDFAEGRWMALEIADVDTVVAHALRLAREDDEPEALARMAHGAVKALTDRAALREDEDEDEDE